MRKIQLTPVLILFASMLLLNACKKETAETKAHSNPTSLSTEIIAKTNRWLETQQAAAGNQGSVIKSLKANLDFNSGHLENYFSKDQFIVIPVLDGFKSKNNEDKKPANYLVLVLTEAGDILKANLIQFIPNLGNKQLPGNTFSKILNYQNLDCDGQFTVLSITDDFRYELKFENGKLKTLGELKKKIHPSNGSGRVNECIDWYYQIWYAWSDGTMELVSEVYVFTTCDGDCSQPRVANGSIFRVDCNGGGGGGGSTTCNSPDARGLSEKESVDETSSNSSMRYKTYTWKVHTVSDGVIPMYLKSVENGIHTNPNGYWKFQSFNHANIVKGGVEILYNVSVENVNPIIWLSAQSGLPDQVAHINLGFNVKISAICDGMPITFNRSANPANSWHVSE